jgi:CO/xanthine dehydrogenase Mo-binding subunit
MLRSAAYWACACTVTVVPETGVVRCEKCTIAVDPGVIINPQQLKRQIEGGAVMGVSHAVLEELAFDQSGVTQDDWISYPILTMADIPEIQVVLINNPSTGTYGAGSEAANALAVPAIVAALHDATGKQMRRIPLKPAYVQELLKG